MPQDTTKQGGRIFADTIHLQLLKARQMPWQRIKALSQWALRRDHVRRLIGQTYNGNLPLSVALWLFRVGV